MDDTNKSDKLSADTDLVVIINYSNGKIEIKGNFPSPIIILTLSVIAYGLSLHTSLLQCTAYFFFNNFKVYWPYKESYKKGH